MTKSEWRRWLAYPALLSLGLGAIVSCAEEPPPPPPQRVAVAPAPPLPPPRPHRAVRRPGHKPAAPPAAPEAAVPEGGDDTAMVGAEAAAAPAAPPPPPVPRSGELIGLDQTAAKRLFGAASEQSEEPPATVWRYRSATCGLDLYFYLDLRSGRMRTLRYAFNGEATDAAGRQSCLRSLVAVRRT
jgi:hypothetical protein